VKTSRILLTLTAGLVLATPIASFAEGTAAPAAAMAEQAPAATAKHHRKHHHRKSTAAKTDAPAPAAK
jgi:hypothetical protein